MTLDIPAAEVPPPPLSRRTLVWRSLAGAALLAGSALFFRHVNRADVWSSLRTASPMFLVGASLANGVSIWVKSWRWQRILSTLGAFGQGEVLRFLLIGFAVNSMLPASAGDVARVYLVARASGQPRGAVLSSIILERVIEAIAFAALMLAVLPALRTVPWVREGAVAFGAFVGVMLVGLSVFAWRHRNPADPSASALVRFAATLAERLRRVGAAPVLAGVVLLSVVEWALQAVSYWCGLRAFGAHVGLLGAFVAVCAVNLALLARVTPGGVGAFQVAFTAAMALYGIPRPLGLACSATLHVVTLVPPVVAGLVLLFLAPRDLRAAIWGGGGAERPHGAATSRDPSASVGSGREE